MHKLWKKDIQAPFSRIHNWWPECVMAHSKWKLALQLLFGIALSIFGIGLVDYIRHFANDYIFGDATGCQGDLEAAMPGLIIGAVVVAFTLYVILTIHARDEERKIKGMRDIILNDLPTALKKARDMEKDENEKAQKPATKEGNQTTNN
jgi:hypothetical protein